MSRRGSLCGLACIACLVWSGTGGQAEGLLNKLGNAASDAADAVVDTTKKVGTAVDQSVTGTTDLLTNEETVAASRAKLDTMADETLVRFFLEIEGARDLFDRSAGYAVFDTRKVSIFPVTAGVGRGVAVSTDSEARTYMQMGTGGLGASLGLGGFEAQVVILFETADRIEAFRREGYDASAEAELKVDRDVTGETLRFDNGRRVFVLGTRGWRVAASVGGTRYWPDPQLNDG